MLLPSFGLRSFNVVVVCAGAVARAEASSHHRWWRAQEPDTTRTDEERPKGNPRWNEKGKGRKWFRIRAHKRRRRAHSTSS
uniref:Putative secreted protein n=1 Tax=Anopheles darlingi TaxID=43151 RepID=A0A2M4D3V0_ANODA